MGNALKGKSSMTPADFDELCHSTSFTCEEIDEWYRKFARSFPKGNIRKYEFLVVYNELFPGGKGGEFCDHVFRLYDRDNNGVISFTEFITTLHVASRGTPEEKLRSMFRMYDVDRDGSVTVKELRQILQSIYMSSGMGRAMATESAIQNAKAILELVDNDGDRRLTEDEFVKASLTHPDIADMLIGKQMTSS